jgi:uncharacterized protein YecT (DUF1311 family)
MPESTGIFRRPAIDSPPVAAEFRPLVADGLMFPVRMRHRWLIETTALGEPNMRRSVKITAGLVLAAAAAAAAIATPAGAVDFSCRNASNAAERAICSDAKLSQLDDRMAVTYGRLWSVSGHRARLGLRDYQHRFLAARNACGSNTRCLRGAYLDQISVLDGKLSETSGD